MIDRKNPQYNIIKEFFLLYNNNNNSRTHNQSLTHTPFGLPKILIKRLAYNLVSVNGWAIAKIFLELNASTKPEIRALTHIGHNTTNLIVNAFVEVGLLKILGRVGPHYYTTGRPVLIYGFYHATPKDVIRAQKGYAVVFIANRNARNELRAKQVKAEYVDSILAIRIYLSSKGLPETYIPDRAIIRSILKKAGFKVDIDTVIMELYKKRREEALEKESE